MYYLYRMFTREPESAHHANLSVISRRCWFFVFNCSSIVYYVEACLYKIIYSNWCDYCRLQNI